MNCPAGKFVTESARIHESDCLDCVPGKYAPTDANGLETDCIQCIAGMHSPVVGATSIAVCLHCPPGTYSLAAASACTECAEGKYADELARGEPCYDCRAKTLGLFLVHEDNFRHCQDIHIYSYVL